MAPTPALGSVVRNAYRSLLVSPSLPEFALLNDRPVFEPTAADLEVVRDRMLASYRPSTVHRGVRQGREMLTWAWRYHPAKAGLDHVQHAWWERWSVKYKWKVRHHTPKIEEIARTMVIADMFRHLSDNEHET